MRGLDSDDIQAVFAALTFVAAVAGWLVNRYVVRRRRLSYRVHWNRPIEVTRPEDARAMDLQIQWQRSEVREPSIVVMRVENVGSGDVDRDHVEQPLTLTFGGRRVVHFEVQETEPRSLARQIMEPGANGGPELRPGPEGPERTLVLPAFRLRRGDRFKLLVLLSGPGDEVDVEGDVSGGDITREGRAGPRSRAGLALGAVALLTGGLLTGVLVTREQPTRPQAETIACPAPGRLGVKGSSALEEVMTALATDYRITCPGASVEVEGTGTDPAISGLVTAGQLDDESGSTANSRVLLAMADEPAGAEPRDPRLQHWPVAVGAFAVVVNRATGVERLSTEQLRRLFAGELPRWDDADLGGAGADVVLVGRKTGSGTRATFEERVLGGPATAPVSSTDCLARDVPDRQGEVLHCELDSTDKLLAKVANTPGAVGYASLAEARTFEEQGVEVVVVDGTYPSLETVADGRYRFWALEKLYRWGDPIAPTVRDHFVGYVTTNPHALGVLRSHGFYLCSDPAFIDGEVATACGSGTAPPGLTAGP